MTNTELELSDGCVTRPGADAVHAGDSEVEDLRAAIVGQKDVLRLDVAVNDSHGVRGAEPVRNLRCDLRGARRREGPRLEPLGQRLALQQLRDRVRDVPVRARVVDGEDARVVQRGDGARFPLEAPEAVFVVDAVGQKLDGHVPVQARVAGAVDLSHAPLPDGGDDLERTDPLALAQRHEAKMISAARGPR